MKAKRKQSSKHLNLIIKAFNAIKETNKPPNPSTVMNNGMIECMNEGERYVISGSEALATFRQLISSIQCQPEWRGKFSEKYISKELRKILSGLSLRTPASLIPRLEDFIEQLQGFQEVRQLVMPIQGLKLEVEAFRLGRTTFKPADQQQLDQLKERAEKTILGMQQSDDDKEYWLLHYREVIDERLGAFDTLAFSETVAEVDQARINASDDIDMALNVLRFLAPYTQDLPEYVGTPEKARSTAAQLVSAIETR